MSIVRSITRSIVQPIVSSVFGADSSISRYFLDFDPVLNSYGELGSAWTASGDFEIEVDFATTSAAAHSILSGSLQSQDTIVIDLTIDNALRVFAYVGTTLQPIVTTVTTGYRNGKLHTVKVTYVGTTVTMFVDGVSIGTGTWALNGSQDIFQFGRRTTTGLYFDGTIANVKLTDLASPANSLEFNLDEPTSAYELPVNNVLGSELVVNGDFATDSDWTKGTGWTISGGQAQITVAASGSGLYQTGFADLSAATHRYIVDVASVSGTALLRLTGGGGGSTDIITGLVVGENIIHIEAVNPDTQVNIIANTGASITVNSITVKQVTNALTYNNIPESNRWLATQVGSDWLGDVELWNDPPSAIGAQWTDNGGGNYSLVGDGSFNALQDSNIVSIGNSYFASFELDSITTDALRFATSSTHLVTNTLGLNTVTFVSDGELVYFSRNGGAATSATIDNVSVKRILEAP